MGTRRIPASGTDLHHRSTAMARAAGRHGSGSVPGPPVGCNLPQLLLLRAQGLATPRRAIPRDATPRNATPTTPSSPHSTSVHRFTRGHDAQSIAEHCCSPSPNAFLAAFTYDGGYCCDTTRDFRPPRSKPIIKPPFLWCLSPRAWRSLPRCARGRAPRVRRADCVRDCSAKRPQVGRFQI